MLSEETLILLACSLAVFYWLLYLFAEENADKNKARAKRKVLHGVFEVDYKLLGLTWLTSVFAGFLLQIFPLLSVIMIVLNFLLFTVYHVECFEYEVESR